MGMCGFPSVLASDHMAAVRQCQEQGAAKCGGPPFRRHRAHGEKKLCWLTITDPTPRFSDVWQAKDLREAFLYVWQGKELEGGLQSTVEGRKPKTDLRGALFSLRCRGLCPPGVCHPGCFAKRGCKLLKTNDRSCKKRGKRVQEAANGRHQ